MLMRIRNPHCSMVVDAVFFLKIFPNSSVLQKQETYWVLLATPKARCQRPRELRLAWRDATRPSNPGGCTVQPAELQSCRAADSVRTTSAPTLKTRKRCGFTMLFLMSMVTKVQRTILNHVPKARACERLKKFCVQRAPVTLWPIGRPDRRIPVEARRLTQWHPEVKASHCAGTGRYSGCWPRANDPQWRIVLGRRTSDERLQKKTCIAWTCQLFLEGKRWPKTKLGPNAISTGEPERAATAKRRWASRTCGSAKTSLLGFTFTQLQGCEKSL